MTHQPLLRRFAAVFIMASLASAPGLGLASPPKGPPAQAEVGVRALATPDQAAAEALALRILADPGFAAANGFPRPILHGLCTYGMTCKAIVDAVFDGDAGAVASYGARFAGVAFPGETLTVNIWKDDGRILAGVVAPSRDDAVVLGGVELIPA